MFGKKVVILSLFASISFLMSGCGGDSGWQAEESKQQEIVINENQSVSFQLIPDVAPSDTAVVSDTQDTTSSSTTSSIITVDTYPAHGKIDISGETVTYTPDRYFSGTETMAFHRGYVDQADYQSFVVTVKVLATNNLPIISGNPTEFVTNGQYYTFTPTAYDPDGDPITFSISGKPKWATFDTKTGTLAGTVEDVSTENGSITYNVRITADDGKHSNQSDQNASNYLDFSITVQ